MLALEGIADELAEAVHVADVLENGLMTLIYSKKVWPGCLRQGTPPSARHTLGTYRLKDGTQVCKGLGPTGSRSLARHTWAEASERQG